MIRTEINEFETSKNIRKINEINSKFLKRSIKFTNFFHK